MDFPVEATINMTIFQDETEVRKILRSHGFEMRDLSRNKVHVQGSFLKLKAAKIQLEQLLNAQTQTSVYSSSHHPVSSGAIPKNYDSSSSLSRSRLGSRNKTPHASPSSPSTFSFQSPDALHGHPASPHHRTSFTPRPDQYNSVRTGSKSFVVEGEVFKYAKCLRHLDIDNILENHDVEISEEEVGESCTIILQGRNARTAADKLQRFLSRLTTSLRTQEVPRKDMNNKGRDLLHKIQKNSNIYNSVLVCEMKDSLHLIGPSLESYELKQKLLGKWVDESRRPGRTLSGNSRRRSSSLPPVSRRTERDSGASAGPSPVATAGYSPSKYQDDTRKRAEPERAAARGRTLSESSDGKQVDRPNGFTQEEQRKVQPHTSKKGLKKLLPFDGENISVKFKTLMKQKKKP
ncbi:hypothetical protein Q5P01_018575 [Channa striata]|uniref:Uncharacterized protein n=1 Tax=Channa striata TaxID=64152 RepID=A0AA88M574_CHASR|nr:hypothetical protein Q5P01_018575 [Channa striata]